jgi:hypothetical protein
MAVPFNVTKLSKHDFSTLKSNLYFLKIRKNVNINNKMSANTGYDFFSCNSVCLHHPKKQQRKPF